MFGLWGRRDRGQDPLEKRRLAGGAVFSRSKLSLDDGACGRQSLGRPCDDLKVASVEHSTALSSESWATKL